MEKYFRLSPDCVLESNAADAALYDVHGRRLFLLDDSAHALLAACEQNTSLDCRSLPPESLDFLEWLTTEGMGFFEDRPAYIDRFLPHSPIMRLVPGPVAYCQLDIAITNRCGFGCRFCPVKPSALTWQACLTCLRCGGERDAAPVRADFQDLVRQAAAMGFTRIHLRGGDPLLEWEAVLQIVRAAESHRQLLVLITTPVSAAHLEDVVSLGAHPQVLLNLVLVADAGSSPAMSPLFRSLVDRLRQERVRFSVTALLGDVDPRDHAGLLESLKGSLGRKPRHAEIRESRGSSTLARFPIPDKAGRRLSRWQNPVEFFARREKSSCLDGRIQLNYDGSLQPCAGVASDCGALDERGLPMTLQNDAIYRSWELDKNRSHSCRDCVVRYACHECLGVVFSRSGVPFCAPDSSEPVRSMDRCWQHDGFVQRVVAGRIKELPTCPNA